MRKAAIIITIVTSLLITSCTKINGESESWFIDNGWVEGILEYGNTYEGIGMQIDASGNIIGIFKTSGYYYNHSESWWEFRLYSSFDQVKELTSAPTDGYVGNFLCDNTKCGVARNHTRSWSNGPNQSWYGPVCYSYYKFYMRRINSYQFRVYFKEVEEWHTELTN